MTSQDIYSKLKALCFVEDSFRSICFFDSARKSNVVHICSTLDDWEAILELALCLINSGKMRDPLKFDLYISEYMMLYKKICSLRKCDVMPWVLSKLKAHVEFFLKLEPFLSVDYDNEVGFRVLWKRSLCYVDNKNFATEFEFQEPSPNFTVPINLLIKHSEFGPQHPITVRSWDFESSETDVEILIGVFALFNSVCPNCKNIEVFRFPKASSQLHEIGYARLTFINIDLILAGDELCFPYQSNWFEQSQLACIKCHQEPTSLLWICDRRSLRNFIIDFIMHGINSKEIYLGCINWLVFNLETKLELTSSVTTQTDTSKSKLFCVSVSAFVAWILKCFSAESTKDVAFLVSGLILHRLEAQEESQFEFFDSRFTKDFFSFLFPQYGEILFDCFSSLFSLESQSGVVQDIQSIQSHFYQFKHDLSESLRENNHFRNVSWNQFSIQSSEFQLALEECMILKILDIQDDDINHQEFTLYCLNTCLDFVVGRSAESLSFDWLDQVRLLFALIACSPLKPSYLSLTAFANTIAAHRVRFQTIRSFISCGIRGCSWYPSFPLDVSPLIADIVGSNIENILDGPTISDFGGHISFLLRKCTVRNNACIRKLSSYFDEAYIRRSPLVTLFFEDYFNGFMNDDAFFCNGDEHEDREGSITQFIYWCLSQSDELNSSWISRLATFHALQIDLCFGRFDKDPLNLWTIIVYLCYESNTSVIQIGNELFDVFDFTKKFIIPILRRTLLIDDPLHECSVSDVYLMTHVVYVLTDYCNWDLSGEFLQQTFRFWKRFFHRFSHLVRCPLRPCFIECMCEIFRKTNLLIVIVIGSSFLNCFRRLPSVHIKTKRKNR